MWVGGVVAALLVAAAVGAVVLWRRASAPAGPVAPADAGDVAKRLDDFWSWWRKESPRLAKAFDEGKADSVVDELSRRVHAIHPDLAWETGPGLAGARHHLALSSEGDITLRVLTERWRSRAPAFDAAWEYYPARQPSRFDAKLDLTLHDAPGIVIAYADARAALEVDEAREVVHVKLHHPAFSRLPEKARSTAAFLVLDDALGEDGVERWVGHLDLSAEPLPAGQPLAALAEAVASLERSATGERWVIIEGRTESGRPLIASVNVALKRLDHLLMDHHLEVTLPFQEQAERGMPTHEENEALNSLEDELLASLGHDAVFIGHETGDGRRVIHFHVAALGPAAERTEAWAQRTGREVTVEYRHDPGWELLKKWR
jgi:hypothetical protein